MTTEQPSASPSRTSGLRLQKWVAPLLLCGTVGWLGFLGLVVSVKSPCLGSDGDWIWRAYLSCRSLNEFGDFLSGAFAPLAFIWLAAAVYFQTQELKIQHKEMQATTETLQEQTKLLRLELDDRQKEIAKRTFDEMAAALMLALNYSTKVPIKCFNVSHGGVGGPSWSYASLDPTTQRDTRLFFKEFLSNAFSAEKALESSSAGYNFTAWDKGTMEVVLGKLTILCGLQLSLPQDHLPYAFSLNLDTVLAAYHRIFDHLGKMSIRQTLV